MTSVGHSGSIQVQKRGACSSPMEEYPERTGGSFGKHGVGCVIGGFLPEKAPAAGDGPALRALRRPSCRGIFLWGVQHPGGAGHGVLLCPHPSPSTEVVQGPEGPRHPAIGTFRCVSDGLCRTALKGFRAGAGHPGAFWALGALTLPVCFGGALWWTRHGTAGQRQNGSAAGLALQMLRTKQYWLCAGAVCFSTPAVLLFSPIILKLGMERTRRQRSGAWCWAAWAARRGGC